MPRTKMDDLAEELNKDEGFETAEKAPEVKPKRKFEQTDLIMCRSVVKGGFLSYLFKRVGNFGAAAVY